MTEAALTVQLLRAAADRAMQYPFKVWGFGEDICLRALQEYSRLTATPAAAEFVAGLVRPWCESTVGSAPDVRLANADHAGPAPDVRLANADHVAPGVVILELYAATGDGVYLDAALQLGALYRSFPEVGGVRVHRPDLSRLNDLIWVDCLALDGPFLARLAKISADESWSDLAIDTTLAYTRALRDPNADLFRHGYDTRTRSQSDCCWARGNGWAMHGLVDTILELPVGQLDRATLCSLLERQVAAVMRLQSPSGHWHTVLDDPTTPLESSATAFFASAVLKARRHGLLGALLDEGLEAMVEAAVAALLIAAADGALPVSYATPVGSRATYVDAPLGVFPWGQGPLLLTQIETQLAAHSRTEGVSA